MEGEKSKADTQINLEEQHREKGLREGMENWRECL
jgi:hypothetical protein